MDMDFSESGNVLNISFQLISTGDKCPWFLGTVSGTNKTVSNKVLTGTSVSISVLDSSSITVD